MFYIFILNLNYDLLGNNLTEVHGEWDAILGQGRKKLQYIIIIN